MNQNMICSEPLPSAGCASGEHESTPSAGCTQGLCKEGDKPTPPQTVRDFEAALRSLGFSRRMAKSISQHGYRATLSEPVAAATEELDAALKKLRGAFNI